MTVYIKTETIGRYFRRALIRGRKSYKSQHLRTQRYCSTAEQLTKITNSHDFVRVSPFSRLMITTNSTRFTIEAAVWSKKNFMTKLRSPDVCARGAHRTCFSFSLWLGSESSSRDLEKRESHARGENIDFKDRTLNAFETSARVGNPG